MGRYYDPKEVADFGRRVRMGDSVCHRLVAVMDNGLWKCAADVTRQSEYAEHHKNYSAGLWLSFDLYDFCPHEDDQ